MKNPAKSTYIKCGIWHLGGRKKTKRKIFTYFWVISQTSSHICGRCRRRGNIKRTWKKKSSEEEKEDQKEEE